MTFLDLVDANYKAFFANIYFPIKKYFISSDHARAYELYGQIYGKYPTIPDNPNDYKYIEYDEQFAIDLVKNGLPNAYKNIYLIEAESFIYYPTFTYSLGFKTTIEEMYNEAKKQNKLSLASAIEDTGYLDVPANIETDNAKLAINNGYFTKEQLIRCNPEKVKALTSKYTLKALEKKWLNPSKLYQFDLSKIKSLTSYDAIKIIKEGHLDVNKLYQFDANKIYALTSENALIATTQGYLDLKELYQFDAAKLNSLTSKYAIYKYEKGLLNVTDLYQKNASEIDDLTFKLSLYDKLSFYVYSSKMITSKKLERYANDYFPAKPSLTDLSAEQNSSEEAHSSSINCNSESILSEASHDSFGVGITGDTSSQQEIYSP